MTRYLPFTAFACLLFAAPCLAALPASIAAQLNQAGIPQDAMGALVIRVTDGRTLLSHGADLSLQPASTMKLLTTLVALERLGPQWRGRTQLRSGAEVIDGVLRGDLVMRGGADMDLDGEALRQLLSGLRRQGIRAIHGDLLLDRGLFRPGRSDVGVPPFDESPEFRYNVIPDALLVNTNLLQLELESDAQRVRVLATPPLAGVAVEPDMALVDRPCNDWEDGWKIPAVEAGGDGALRVRLRGEFPRDCKATTQVAVIERDAYIDRLFRSLWEQLGGTFAGVTRAGTAPDDSRLLAEHVSRPLAELARDVNKASDNPDARLLFLMLGTLDAASSGQASTLLLAEREVRAWLARHGIDGAGLVLENGSGLSRLERIRPRQLAAILDAGRHSGWAPEFLSSLPIAALDGTLRKRLRDSPASQRARLKTGTLRDVVAIAGYVPDAAGETCIVVAIINDPRANADAARPILDAFVDWVARSGESGRRAPRRAPVTRR